MPQGIKNFSEALVITPKLDVVLSYKVHGYVIGHVEFNGQRCAPGDNIFQIDILDPIELTSYITDFVEGTSAIEITKLTVSGYEALPKYQHLTSDGTCYHDWLGELQLSITDPFYVWYHHVTGQGWIA